VHLVRDIAFGGVYVGCLKGFGADVGTRGTILAVAELEADEDLCVALRPFEDWGGVEVFPVLHLDLLQHALVDLEALVDDS
jgi:hypothetical protein